LTFFSLLSPKHGAFWGFRGRRWPPCMENDCEYIEKSVANSQQRVVQVGGCTRNQHLLTLKKSCYKCYIILRNLKDSFWKCLGKWFGRTMWHEWEGENNIQALMVKSEGRRSLGRSVRRWKSTVEMDRKGIGCECVGCIKLAQDRISNRLLWTRHWAFGFYKIWKIYRLNDELLACQERLSYMDLIR